MKYDLFKWGLFDANPDGGGGGDGAPEPAVEDPVTPEPTVAPDDPAVGPPEFSQEAPEAKPADTQRVPLDRFNKVNGKLADAMRENERLLAENRMYQHVKSQTQPVPVPAPQVQPGPTAPDIIQRAKSDPAWNANVELMEAMIEQRFGPMSKELNEFKGTYDKAQAATTEQQVQASYDTALQRMEQDVHSEVGVMDERLPAKMRKAMMLSAQDEAEGMIRGKYQGPNYPGKSEHMLADYKAMYKGLYAADCVEQSNKLIMDMAAGRLKKIDAAKAGQPVVPGAPGTTVNADADYIEELWANRKQNGYTKRDYTLGIIPDNLKRKK